MMSRDRTNKFLAPASGRAIFRGTLPARTVHQLLLALGIELTVGRHQSLKALPGISDLTRNTEIVSVALEHQRIAAWCQWSFRILASNFVHVRNILLRCRSIRDRNIPNYPAVVDLRSNPLAVLEAQFSGDPGNDPNLGSIGRVGRRIPSIDDE